MPDYDEMEPSGENRHAFEWGLASLLMGCFLALGAPVTLIFNVMILVAGPRAIPPQFAGLLWRSTQPPAQATSGRGQFGTQVPRPQSCPCGQALPQRPQFWASVS